MKFYILLLVTFVTLSHVSSQRGGHSPVTRPEEKARLIKIVKDNLCTFKGCWELEKVESITTQDVAGSLSIVNGIFEEVMEDKFYKGSVKIFEQPWTKITEVTFQKGAKVQNW